ncbi:hypothetical protein CEXT_761571 [Caerostris extrusa]|uniref:Uncharacterized protein n=1 Tax=Caerostris extrusa TaxID=172846 RepID=A0AAV4UI53_CAEEX|nr:hypothetical protein CEXT_761571 [Caerostris extrusa]
MVLKEDIPDSITNSITSALDLDNGTFSNKPPSLQPFFEEDWIGSCSSAKSPLTKDSENLNAVSIAEVSETLLENKHHSNVNKVEEPNSNSLVEYNVSSPNEVFPSNVEPPSTDTDSNHIETTLGSITNYLLEDPFDKFTDALISFFQR